jgi:hypothetical protein
MVIFKKKAFTTLYASFGAYGFWRQYNIIPSDRERFFTEKVFFSLTNTSLYLLPPYNIYAFIKLLNRLEIQSKGFDKTLYKDQYTEFFGDINYSTW